MYENIFDYANTAFTTETDFLDYLKEVYNYGVQHVLHIPEGSEDIMVQILEKAKENLLERKEVTKEELDPMNIQLSVFIFNSKYTRRFLLHPGVLSFDSPFEVHKIKDYCHQIYQYPKGVKLIAHDGFDPTPLLHVVEGTTLDNQIARATLTILTKDNKREYYFVPEITY